MIPLIGAVDYISNPYSKALLLLSRTIDHDYAKLSRCSEPARAMSAPCGLRCVNAFGSCIIGGACIEFCELSVPLATRRSIPSETFAELDLVFKSNNQELVW